MQTNIKCEYISKFIISMVIDKKRKKKIQQQINIGDYIYTFFILLLLIIFKIVYMFTNKCEELDFHGENALFFSICVCLF